MDTLEFLLSHAEISVAVVFISGLTLWLSLHFFLKYKKIKSELSTLNEEIAQVLSKSVTIDLELFDVLATKMKKNGIVSHAWNEFDETVIREDSDDGKIVIYNTRAFSDFFKIEQVFENYLSLNSLQKMPMLITSIGLLFTFIFIILGLSHLKPQPSGKIEGIPDLITGLSGKFISSVLGIVGSIFFSYIEGRYVKGIQYEYHKLVDLLDSKFNRKTSEDYLRSLDKNMRELNFSMKRFSTDLATVIKEGLQEGMRPSTDRLLVAIENLERQKSENIADTLSKLLNDFKSSLNQSTGSEFAALGNSVTKLADTMNQSAEQSFAVSNRMDNLVKALDSQILKQEQSSDASVTKLQQGFEHLLSSIEKNTKEQNDNLNKLLSDVVAKTSLATSGLITNVESLSAKNSAMVNSFDGLNENIAKSVQSYQQAVESTKSLISSTSDLANNLNSSLAQLASVQTKIDQTFQQFLQETNVVQGIQKENANSVTRFTQVFSEVERGLGSILEQVATNLQRYNDLTRTGLDGYLKQYDDSLSSATTRLSSTVKDLDEVLENFNDHLEAINKAVSKGN